jgi:phosphoribosylglycinamide formyltransferase-1
MAAVAARLRSGRVVARPGSSPTSRLAVLASGSGTVLDALLAAGLPVAVVLADRKCRALEVAAEHGVAAELVERADFTAAFDREGFTNDVVERLRSYRTDAIAMAGFMTVMTASVFVAYPDAVFNTHPSLLPAFPGAHAVRDALAYGVKVTGCTVHIATETVDHGPILAQEAVEVRGDDTEETLHERIKAVERRLYPQTLQEVLR